LEIGKLNQKITILENQTVIDEIGNHVAKWYEIYNCWAYVTVKKSSENTETGVTRESLTLQFMIRENSFTRLISSTKNRIKYHDTEFNITEIILDFNRKDYIKIVGEMRKEGDKNGFFSIN
jgi:SPP1 family predicted phage head-tail adaptor